MAKPHNAELAYVHTAISRDGLATRPDFFLSFFGFDVPKQLFEKFRLHQIVSSRIFERKKSDAVAYLPLIARCSFSSSAGVSSMWQSLNFFATMN